MFINILIAIFVALSIIGSIRGIAQQIYNSKQRILPVQAKIIAQRIVFDEYFDIYYTTFEFSNGQSIELRIPEDVYAEIDEGDMGILYIQGSRYIDFEYQEIEDLN